MIELSAEQYGVLFPAFILVDDQAVVQQCGPSIRRLIPDLAEGTPLLDHFGSPAWDRNPSLDYWAESGGPIWFHSSDGKFVLAGVACRSGKHFLFAPEPQARRPVTRRA